MAAGGIAIVLALLQRANGEGVPQIVNARAWLTGSPSQADRSREAERMAIKVW